MEYKVYYFSGTGNTYYYAYYLAKELNVEACNIYEEENYNLKGKTVILLFPNYFGRIPLGVEEFLDKIECDYSTTFYAFVSATKKNGNILEKLDSILQRKSTKVSFGSYIKSPNNNIISMWGKCTGPHQSIKLLNSGKTKILSYLSLIKDGKEEAYPKYKNMNPKKYAKLDTKEFKEKLSTFGDKFMLNGECIRCRMCELNCKRANIGFLEGILVWKDKCEGCLNCISNCPYNAIEFEGITRGKVRYKNPLVGIDEYGFYVKGEEE